MLPDPELKSKTDALWDRFWSGGVRRIVGAKARRGFGIECPRAEVSAKRHHDMSVTRGKSLRPRWTGKFVAIYPDENAILP